MAGKVYTNWLSATEKKAALKRIGYHRYRGSRAELEVDLWNVLNWFVQLGNSCTPFSDMPMAEVELLTQEYRALQEEDHPPGVPHGLVQNIVTISDLEKFRATVRLHTEQLADTGQTRFGPFTLERSVYILDHGESEIVVGEYVEPFHGQGLLLLLSSLVQRVGLAIRRCPHCREVFLKPRRDAKACSRTCQANAYARHQREAAQRKKVRMSEKRKNRGRNVGKSQKRQPGATIQRLGKG
ncbi:MAG: hypothetical protein E8D46_13075 [Nitrospira sp.]|nr:MAG: hypothetical protein E8D46_13075 [Nitrospira sp.]